MEVMAHVQNKWWPSRDKSKKEWTSIQKFGSEKIHKL